jgi:glycosyltransferase involved in cell wall biosynthesis
LTLYRVLVAIPVFNEEKNIASLLFEIQNYFSRTDILVVDDGSTDQTVDILKDCHCQVVTHVHNRGKGAALMTAIDFAQKKAYEWIICMDGDGQHSPRFLPDFNAAIVADRFDIIIGSRYERHKRMPFHRILSNSITSVIISLCVNKCRIKDSQSGYRAFRLSALNINAFHETGFQLESEMLIKLGRAGSRIHQIPVDTIYNDEDSSINVILDTMKFILLIIKSFFW